MTNQKVKTLGLIGYGHIAQKVAKIGHAFSMKVIFYNHRPKKVPEPWMVLVSNLRQLFVETRIN